MMKTTTLNSFSKFLLLSGAFFLSSQSITAQVSLTAIGAPYVQNFDGLASTGTGLTVTIPGWSIFETGANANQFYITGTGSVATGDTYSYGTTASSERALGSLASANLLSSYGASFINNTGSYITDYVISYTGEQWRSGDITGPKDSLIFEYSLNATSLSNASGTWLPLSSLNFKSPITTSPTGLLDGNLVANRTTINSVISGLSIPVGGIVSIRWTDQNIAGNDDGLGIDDFSLTPMFMPRVNVMDVSLSEGASGTTSFDFSVYLSVPAGPGGVTFDIATSDNTALSASDYVAKTLTTQTIPQGANTYTFSVLVNGDATQELDEDFFVTVTNVINGQLQDGLGLGTIINDDIIPPYIMVQPENFTECNGGVATFYSLGGGDPTPTAQWEVSVDGGTNWNSMPLETGNMLTFTSNTSQNGNMYRIIYTNTEGADTSYEATLYVNPTYNLNATDSVCSGSSYQYPDGTIVTNLTTTDTHTSNLTNMFGCDSIINTTVNVNPVYNLSETATVCEGDSYVFPDATIQNLIGTQVIHVSNLTTLLGCDSIITTTVNVNMIDSTSITATICAGEIFNFHGTILSTANTYYFDTTNVSGCDSVIVLDLIVNPSPIPAFTFVINVDTLYTSNTSTGGITYLWNFDDGNGYSNTGFSPSHIYPSNGTYTVCLRATSSLGCSDTFCSPVTIQAISINELNSTSTISVFPNPTHDKLSIEFATEVNTVKISLVNMLGQTIKTEAINSKTSKIDLNLSLIETGIYYLLIENGTEHLVKKIIIE